jgi:hypothetical protein
MFHDDPIKLKLPIVLSALTQHYDFRHKRQGGFDDFQSGPGKQFRQVLPNIVSLTNDMTGPGST